MDIKDRFDPTTGKNIQQVKFAAPLFQLWDPEDDVEEPIGGEQLMEWAAGRGYISSRDGHILARMLVSMCGKLAELLP